MVILTNKLNIGKFAIWKKYKYGNLQFFLWRDSIYIYTFEGCVGNEVFFFPKLKPSLIATIISIGNSADAHTYVRSTHIYAYIQ